MQGEKNLPAKRHIAHSESLRQGYLKAMGIQTWFPRYQLTNAQLPRLFEGIAEDTDTSTPAAIHQPSSDYSPTKPADILGQFIPATQPVEEPAAPPDTVKQPTVPASQFRLVIVSVSDDCLVVAEMPHTGLNQFSRFHQQLLNDILRALNISTNSAPAIREFVWPMTDRRGLLSQLEQDDDAAADAVNVYLNTQHDLARRKTILLLGQAAARFVLNPQKKFEQLRGLQTNSGQRFAVTYSLNELMKQSVLKREAWQDLAPLPRA